MAILSSSDVCSPETFGEFVRQRLGTPSPSAKEMIILKRQLKDFFAKYPHAGYSILVKVVEWAKAKRYRPSHVYTVLTYVRYAWSAGMLPDLNPPTQSDPEIEFYISLALKEETDERLRRMLTSGADRHQAYRDWQTIKAGALA